jgi:two-component system, cell cycle response regulator CpdR
MKGRLMNDHQRPAVLLVEDDVVFREYLARAIERNGYDVYTASDGVQGIVQFNGAGDHIHVVLSDIVMPNMDGIEFCQHISASARHIFNFLFITGFGSLALRASGSFPQHKMVQKPFHIRDIMLDLDRCMANVVHKRKRLTENLTAGLHAKMDQLLEKIEGKIHRAEDAIARNDNRTLVLGSGNSISILNDNRSVQIVNNVVPGDFATIERALSEIGISPRYIEDLKTAVELDANSDAKEGLGNNSERWFKRTLRSVGKGTTKVAGDVATAMLTGIVATYFGLPS